MELAQDVTPPQTQTGARPWYAIDGVEQIATPALAVYLDRVEHNLAQMIKLAGGTARLRPHVKTHKMAALVRRQLTAGITRFKCATIAEAEMCAQCGAADVLLAHQPVGPAPARLARLARLYPRTAFGTIADDESVLHALSAACAHAATSLDVYLDLDNGMHRTGIPPGPQAAALYRLICRLPHLEPGGLHVYDGHVRDSDPLQRASHAEADFAPVLEFRDALEAAGLPVPRLVAGGTPTFPVHARHRDRQCSPGTCLFWDMGYSTRFAELPFLHAALVLSRVISKPGETRICLDAGYKAVAADPPLPRLHVFGLPDAQVLVHNEEHLALESAAAGGLRVGDVVYGVPQHICPTCALHREALVVQNGVVVDRWEVTARDRCLTV
jgi:D-serine deaminase-like pyridoxal phosphate-dependent protein